MGSLLYQNIFGFPLGPSHAMLVGKKNRFTFFTHRAKGHEEKLCTQGGALGVNYSLLVKDLYINREVKLFHIRHTYKRVKCAYLVCKYNIYSKVIMKISSNYMHMFPLKGYNFLEDKLFMLSFNTTMNNVYHERFSIIFYKGILIPFSINIVVSMSDKLT